MSSSLPCFAGQHQRFCRPPTGQQRKRRGIRPCAAGRETARQMDLQRLPPAPPPLASIPPPPPPPPPETPTEEGGLARRAFIAAGLVGGAALWWSYLNSQMPRVYTGKRGVSYVKTAGGNTVGVKMDTEGRLYMFDRAGNLYYDTGDQRLGFYIVTADNKTYNVYLDDMGEEQRRYVGDIRDVRTFKVHPAGPIYRTWYFCFQENRRTDGKSSTVTDLGGISVETLQKASDGRFDGTITAFPDDNAGIPLPPNAPMYKRKDGTLQAPPELEEGVIRLENKRSWWPLGSGGNSTDNGGPLRRGDG